MLTSVNRISWVLHIMLEKNTWKFRKQQRYAFIENSEFTVLKNEWMDVKLSWRNDDN